MPTTGYWHGTLRDWHHPLIYWHHSLFNGINLWATWSHLWPTRVTIKATEVTFCASGVIYWLYWNTVSSPSEVQWTRRHTGSFLAIPLTNAMSSECFRNTNKMPQIPVINDTGTKTVESPGILLWAMGAALWATDVILWATDVILWATEIIFWANGIIF
jgi:hypothetical protein